MISKPFLLLAFLLQLIWTPSAIAGNVLVFAAASTTNVVSDLAKLYQEKTGQKITPSFAGSSILAKQIASGAPAGIFISANELWMDYLSSNKAILDETRRNLFGNTLVVAAQKNSPLENDDGNLAKLKEIAGKDRFALGDPDHVPAGIYARQALQHLKIWNDLNPKAARMPNVRAALAMIERGEVAFGIIYNTDAKISDKLKIIATFPPSSHPAITYPIAMVRGNDTPETRDFYDFLTSPAAHKLFTKHGFLVSN